MKLESTMLPKTTSRWLKRPRHHATVHCEAAECGKVTTGQKPFCLDHLEHNPYVHVVWGRIAARADEWKLVRDLGAPAVDPDSSLSFEILFLIWMRGPTTLPRLTQVLFLEQKTLSYYIYALWLRGALAVAVSDRHHAVMEVIYSPVDGSRNPWLRGAQDTYSRVDAGGL